MLHNDVPVWHAAGVQGVLATHAPQVPWLLQTMFMPHSAPASTSPIGLHVVPDEQDATPRSHGLLNVQVPPVTHGPQNPELHTAASPQGVPSLACPAVGLQTAVPLAHETRPVPHGEASGVQSDPPAHGTQFPLLHTIPVPQRLPSF